MTTAPLPEQGHSTLHNQLQSLVLAIMKLGGIPSKKEAVNFLLGKVGDPHITLYVNHVSRQNGNRRSQHAIIHGIHVTNFPVGRQRINDSGSIPGMQRQSSKSRRPPHAKPDTPTTTQQTYQWIDGQMRWSAPTARRSKN